MKKILFALFVLVFVFGCAAQQEQSGAATQEPTGGEGIKGPGAEDTGPPEAGSEITGEESPPEPETVEDITDDLSDLLEDLEGIGEDLD